MSTPDGYAVVQADGHFVGIWRAKDVADKVVNRSPSIKGESVRPMQFLDRPSTERTPMNAPESPPQLILPVALGAEFENGYYGGRVIVDGKAFDCELPPKALSEHKPIAWNNSDDRVADAQSFNDSAANTRAMATAGSKLAQWALDNGMVSPPLLDCSPTQPRPR
jgi:hypothetical protein